MSITSEARAGDEEGRGGVVIVSSVHPSVSGSARERDRERCWFYSPRPSPPLNMFDVNKDLRGVAS